MTLGTIEPISSDGSIGVKLDSGRVVDFDPQRYPHLDYGYAVTSHSSQGQTADRVLIQVDTELGARDLLNSRMAYVAVSRGRWDAQIFTDSRERLPAVLGRDVSHTSAWEESWILPSLRREPQPRGLYLIRNGYWSRSVKAS